MVNLEDLLNKHTQHFVGIHHARRPDPVVNNYYFYPDKLSYVHKTANVKTVLFDSNVVICQNADIRRGVKISSGSLIAPNSVVHEDVRIGEGSFIGPNCILHEASTICHKVVLKENVVVHDDAYIGNNSTILTNCVIGKEAYLEKYSTVARDIIIPDGYFSNLPITVIYQPITLLIGDKKITVMGNSGYTINFNGITYPYTRFKRTGILDVAEVKPYVKAIVSVMKKMYKDKNDGKKS